MEINQFLELARRRIVCASPPGFVPQEYRESSTNKKVKRGITVGFLVAGLLLMTGRTESFAAGAPEDFYRGKTVSWIVSSEPGSPTDLIVRTIAPFLAKEIGAKVRVENMKTDEGINHLYKQGSREGLSLGAKTTDAVIGNEILKAPGVLYETEKLNFIADVYPSIKMFQIGPKLPYKNIEALKKAKGLRGGGTSAKGSLALSAAVMFEILGLDGKVITGYQGKKNLLLAMARGEADFMVTSDDTAMRDEKDDYIVNLFAVGDKRSPVVPHAPSLVELGVKIPKELAAAHNFIITGGIAVAMSPGVPGERVEQVRRIFQGLNNNAELQAAMTKLTGAWRPFVAGKELQQDMAVIKADQELANRLDTIFKKYSAVR